MSHFFLLLVTQVLETFCKIKQVYFSWILEWLVKLWIVENLAKSVKHIHISRKLSVVKIHGNGKKKKRKKLTGIL